MRRNLKVLGLALVAAFALSAIASGSASAEIATFTSGSPWTTLTATALNTQTFTAGTRAVKCESVVADNASMGEDQSTITVEPTYGKTVKSEEFTEAETNETECEIETPTAKFKAMVHTNGCHYKFTAGGTVDGSVHIECPVGKEIEVTIDILGKFRPCLDIPAQTPTTPTVTYTNETYLDEEKNVWDVKVTSHVEGVKYTETGVCGTEVKNNANYTGEVTVKGFNTAGTPVDVTWDKET